MDTLDLRHVSYTFGRQWALKNVSFTLEKGDFCLLTGPSGAGKTTLLRLLYGSLPLKRGQAHVAGFSLAGLSRSKLPSLRRQVSVVFQDFRILPEQTVEQNIALALKVRCMDPNLIKRRVRAVLRSLSLEHKAAERCANLSGGEQQRVAIGRAIVVNPQVLLADEPTGNLDHELSMRLLDVLRQFNSFGTTILLATHSPEIRRALFTSETKAKELHLVDGAIAEANFPRAVVCAASSCGEALDAESGDAKRTEPVR